MMKPKQVHYDLGANQFGQPIKVIVSDEAITIKREGLTTRDHHARIDISVEQLARLMEIPPHV